MSDMCYHKSLKGKRNQNEDAANIIINLSGKDKSKAPINFYAIYDGHGGKFVSKFLSENLPKCFMNPNVLYPLKSGYIQKVYKYWQEILKSDDLKKKAYNTGSTCLVVVQFKYKNENYLNIANTGDCRAVLCNRKNEGISLTKDHKPDWPDEKERITKLGGKIRWDGYDYRIADLSVSRAFGDISGEPYITCLPDLTLTKLHEKDKFYILGCDGLWDVFSSQDAVNIVLNACYDIKTGKRINNNINIANKLAEAAIKKGSTDNVSATVVFI
jgi:serine/threonine protein phosphatase PrpC